MKANVLTPAPLVVSPVESVSIPAPAEVATLSNNRCRAAARELLHFGTLPKGFSSLLRAVGTDEQKSMICGARALRAETLANKDARRAVLAQAQREILSAKTLNVRDKRNGSGSMSWKA